MKRAARRTHARRIAAALDKLPAAPVIPPHILGRLMGQNNIYVPDEYSFLRQEIAATARVLSELETVTPHIEEQILL